MRNLVVRGATLTARAFACRRYAVCSREVTGVDTLIDVERLKIRAFAVDRTYCDGEMLESRQAARIDGAFVSSHRTPLLMSQSGSSPDRGVTSVRGVFAGAGKNITRAIGSALPPTHSKAPFAAPAPAGRPLAPISAASFRAAASCGGLAHRRPSARVVLASVCARRSGARSDSAAPGSMSDWSQKVATRGCHLQQPCPLRAVTQVRSGRMSNVARSGGVTDRSPSGIRPVKRRVAAQRRDNRVVPCAMSRGKERARTCVHGTDRIHRASPLGRRGGRGPDGHRIRA